MRPHLHISPPESTATRSCLADWLELKALAAQNEAGLPVASTLGNSFDISSDPALAESGDDEELLGTEAEERINAVLDELSYRHSLLGADYPFEVDFERGKLAFKTASLGAHKGAIAYLFCLLGCALREKQISGPGKWDTRLGDLFQTCACLAAGGYLGGQVSSFGFPRKDKSGFWDALKATYKRFGSGEVLEDNRRAGISRSLKDGGVDIIAWKDHPDTLPAKLYLLGQCASGGYWKEKSVREFIEQLHHCFSTPPATHSIPALFIPFPLHHELEQAGNDFQEELRARFWHEEARYGIIFDRFRVVNHASQCLGAQRDILGEVDGAGRFGELADWVGEAVQAIRTAH